MRILLRPRPAEVQAGEVDAEPEPLGATQVLDQPREGQRRRRDRGGEGLFVRQVLDLAKRYQVQPIEATSVPASALDVGRGTGITVVGASVFAFTGQLGSPRTVGATLRAEF